MYALKTNTYYPPAVSGYGWVATLKSKLLNAQGGNPWWIAITEKPLRGSEPLSQMDLTGYWLHSQPSDQHRIDFADIRNLALRA